MTVVRLVVERATQGERDPDRLCNSVLSVLNGKDHTASSRKGCRLMCAMFLPPENIAPTIGLRSRF
jgi:hypothetical protein